MIVDKYRSDQGSIDSKKLNETTPSSNLKSETTNATKISSNLKCAEETEEAQANFTALTKSWSFLSANQKNFCSQKPLEDDRLWRNYMACVTSRIEDIKVGDRNDIVRKIVCQDQDDTLEVRVKTCLT